MAKMGKDGLGYLWSRVFSLIKLITGDVPVSEKGNLQTQINNIKTFTKSGSSAAGGLVPKPPTTAGTTKFLREDGSWSVPPDTNTTYSNMTAATSSAAGRAGLVPAPAAGAQTKFLRGDGTWQTPTDTNTDTKNTAGTTNKTGTKMFLAGATSQAANPQTYSNSNVYIGTDNELYSGGKKVAHQADIDKLNSKLILDYSNSEYKTVSEYTATKRCRVYYTGYTSDTAFLSYQVNSKTIAWDNVSFDSGITRANFHVDLNTGDIFKVVINSGTIYSHTMVVIPFC